MIFSLRSVPMWLSAASKLPVQILMAVVSSHFLNSMPTSKILLLYPLSMWSWTPRNSSHFPVLNTSIFPTTRKPLLFRPKDGIFFDCGICILTLSRTTTYLNTALDPLRRYGSQLESVFLIQYPHLNGLPHDFWDSLTALQLLGLRYCVLNDRRRSGWFNNTSTHPPV